MAGQTIASFSAGIPPAGTLTLTPVVPAGKHESVCLTVALAYGAAVDAAVTVIAVDPVNLPGGILLVSGEPVRYRQPGGSPVLLQNFILPQGWQLKVQEASGAAAIHITLHNRWRFDLVAGQTQPLSVTGLVAAAAPATIFGPVPAGKACSICLLAADAAATDNYVQVVLIDPVNAPGGVDLIYQEPVRYKQVAGSPVLLQDFIVNAGCSIQVAQLVAGAVNFTVYNGWQFDA